MDFYTYFRSSAAFRVRIALNLKGLPATYHAVNLREQGHLDAAYRALNPQALVPALVDQGQVITQSLAIIEYLDEAYPDTPPMMWGSPLERAKIRSLAQMIVCEVHPLHNLRVLNHLRGDCGLDDKSIQAWCGHWISSGLAAFEQALAGVAGRYCVGDEVSLADVALVPQVFSAERYGVSMVAYPQIQQRFDALMALEPFAAAQPARQPDAV